MESGVEADEEEKPSTESGREIESRWSGVAGALVEAFGEAKRPFSMKSSSPPATRWNSGIWVMRDMW